MLYSQLMDRHIIGYMRVSTQEQADSRLGLDAQRTAERLLFVAEQCAAKGAHAHIVHVLLILGKVRGHVADALGHSRAPNSEGVGRKNIIDQVAAVLILQAFLEARANERQRAAAAQG